MKKYRTIPLLLAAALALSACEASDNIQAENGGTPSQTTTENTPQESGGDNPEENGGNSDENGENSDESTENVPEESGGESNGNMPSDYASDDGVQELIEQFDVDSFTAPDGTEVKLTEAVSQINDFALCFDFACIRYAFPIYSDTVTNPEIYDFENFEFTVDSNTKEVPEYFRVRKGDVLDNGMTVTEANYVVTPYNVNYAFENSLMLEGECTLEGVLFCAPEDEYMVAQDDVYFYPNPASGVVPDPCDPYSHEFGEVPLIRPVDLYSEFAFVSDGGSFHLGNVHELDVDIADWFADGPYVRVKVTLDGMRLRYSDNFGTQGWSTLKSAELID